MYRSSVLQCKYRVRKYLIYAFEGGPLTIVRFEVVSSDKSDLITKNIADNEWSSAVCFVAHRRGIYYRVRCLQHHGAHRGRKPRRSRRPVIVIRGVDSAVRVSGVVSVHESGSSAVHIPMGAFFKVVTE